MPSPCRFSVDALQAQRSSLRVLALGVLLDEHHAEDAVQETIIQTLEHGPRDANGLGPWMRTVCRNLALNLRRRSARQRRREQLAAQPEPVQATHDEAELVRAWVVEAVIALPEPYRDAILRRYYENQPPREIARQLSVPTTTIYSRLQKGLQQLRAGIEQRRRREGVDRDATRAALGAIAGWPVVGAMAAAAPPGATMVALAAVALLLLAALGWWIVPEAAPTTAPVVAAPAERIAPPPARAAVGAGGAVTERERAEASSLAALPPPLRVVGRALDSRRCALPGAVVTAHRVGGDPVTAIADATGAFALALRLAAAGVDEAGVLLQKGNLAALRRLPIPCIAAAAIGADRVDLGAVVLAEAVPVRVQVRSPRPFVDLPDLRVLARLVDHVPAGVMRPVAGEVFLGSYRVDGDGCCRLPAVPRGLLVLRAFAPAAGLTGVARAAVTESSLRVDVPLESGVECRVAPVDGGFAEWPVGLPLLAATIERETLDLPGAIAVDRDGRAVLGPLPRSLGVRLQPSTWRWNGRVGPPPHPSERNDLRWTVPGARAKAPSVAVPVYPFLAGALGQPQAGLWCGDRIELPAAGIVGDGRVLVAFLPDGRRLRLEVGDGEGKSAGDGAPRLAECTGPRTVTVELVDADERPVAGMPVHAVERREGPGLHAVAVTDADGRAVLNGLHRGVVELSTSSPGPLGRRQRQPLGVVPAGLEDAALRWCFGRARRVELQILVGGAPRLPAAIEVGTDRGVVGPVHEDADRGAVRFDVWANRGEREVPVVVKAPGCRPAGVLVSFPGTEPVRQRVALQPLAPVEIAVTAPPDGEYDLLLEVLPATQSRWWRVTGVQLLSGPRPHEYRIDGVPCGRYRLRDRLSDACSEPFVVDRAGGRATFDLSAQRWAQAAILLPPGLDAADLEVRDGERGERSGSAPGVQLDRQAQRIRARIASGDGRTVVVRHPGCGEVTIRLDPERSAPIELARRCELRFRLALPDAKQPPPVRVRLCQDAETAVDMRVSPDADGAYALAAPAGYFALRIDVPARAPVCVAAVEVAGTTDLGTLLPEVGERVAVRLLVRDDMLVPRAVATVVDLDGQELQRVVVAGREAFSIRGLLPGRYRLRLRSAAGELLRVRSERAFEVAAGVDAAVTFDLRGRGRGSR